MTKILIKNGLLVNRGESVIRDVLIVNERIERIDPVINDYADTYIDGTGKWIIPGIIDDQVHFREPGLEHKGNIYTESRAALAGGVTSFMEMPNTKPPAVTNEQLEKKYHSASKSAITNYSFYIGATNENIEEVLKTNPKDVCGIKVFMGSSTGKMLVDKEKALEDIFSRAHMLVATHCEDEATIRNNLSKYEKELPTLSAEMHPVIRSREGCLKSSSYAVELAERFGTRLHVLHISTRDELALFKTGKLRDKHITAEACVHHLFFNDSFYGKLGNRIKCNPAIKTREDQEAIFDAVINDQIDVIATDHAPHTWEEKSQKYFKAPSGLPLVQHSLQIMLDFYHKEKVSREKLVEKMCHAPADLFGVEDRGYLDEGKYGDVVIVDPEYKTTVSKKNLLYKCQWSPLEGMMFRGKVSQTIVNGVLKYTNDKIVNDSPGSRLTFRN